MLQLFCNGLKWNVVPHWMTDFFTQQLKCWTSDFLDSAVYYFICTLYLNMWASNLKANSLYWQTCFSNHLPPLKTDKLKASDSLLKRQVAIHVQASGYRCLQSTPSANLQYTQSQFAHHHRHAHVELVVYTYQQHVHCGMCRTSIDCEDT